MSCDWEERVIATAASASALSRESNVRLVDMEWSLPCRYRYSIEQTFSGSSRFLFRWVGFLVDDALQGGSPFPTSPLKLRLVSEVIYISHTEIGHRLHVSRDVENGTKSVRRQDADPADANALCARGEPQILYRADG